MNADTINMIHISQQSTKIGLKNNLKEILDHAKQSIEAKKYENEIITLTTSFWNLQGKQIHMSDLDMAHRQLVITI